MKTKRAWVAVSMLFALGCENEKSVGYDNCTGADRCTAPKAKVLGMPQGQSVALQHLAATAISALPVSSSAESAGAHRRAMRRGGPSPASCARARRRGSAPGLRGVRAAREAESARGRCAPAGPRESGRWPRRGRGRGSCPRRAGNRCVERSARVTEERAHGVVAPQSRAVHRHEHLAGKSPLLLERVDAPGELRLACARGAGEQISRGMSLALGSRAKESGRWPSATTT
jgi:hypothetical protein